MFHSLMQWGIADGDIRGNYDSLCRSSGSDILMAVEVITVTKSDVLWSDVETTADIYINSSTRGRFILLVCDL